MAAKLVVTNVRGGSKISLVGASGTELLSSKVFTEPRAKGATLRALKGLFGEEVAVEDQTAATTKKTAPAPARTPSASAKAAPRASKAVAAASRRQDSALVASDAEQNGTEKPVRRRSRKATK